MKIAEKNQGKMVGTNLKGETMKLMDRRKALEHEMNVIIQRLCRPGGPGLHGNLIDSEVSAPLSAINLYEFWFAGWSVKVSI